MGYQNHPLGAPVNIMMNNATFHDYIATLNINELRIMKVDIQRELNKRLDGLDGSDNTFEKCVSSYPDYIGDDFADEILTEAKKLLTDNNRNAVKPVTV